MSSPTSSTKAEPSVDIEMARVESDKPSGQVTIDPVFGEVTAGDADYRKTTWPLASFLMMKTQIGIGALSIPAAFLILGLIPGILVLALVAVMATWANVMVGRFCIRHPSVFSLDQACKLMFGRIGEYIALTCMMLYYVFTAAAALVSVSVCFNALSNHGLCTANFVAIAAVIAVLLASVPKVNQLSWAAPLAMGFILSSIFTLCVAVSLQRPAAAPQTGPWSSDFQLFAKPTFPQAMAAVAMIIFSFTGTPYFFTIMTEMKNPKQYFKAMYVCQAVVWLVYTIIGTMVYYFCGSYVTAPALGSAGHTIKIVAYGLALPGLLITEAIVSHIPAKTLWIRFMKGSKHLAQNTWQHWASWFGSTFGVVLIAYIIASAVPNFSSLVSLIGAMFGTPIVTIPYGLMWWNLHGLKVARAERNVRWYCDAAWATFIIVAGIFCTVFGTWGALQNIIQEYQAASGASVWSCADNSNSR